MHFFAWFQCPGFDSLHHFSGCSSTIFHLHQKLRRTLPVRKAFTETTYVRAWRTHAHARANMRSPDLDTYHTCTPVCERHPLPFTPVRPAALTTRGSAHARSLQWTRCSSTLSAGAQRQLRDLRAAHTRGRCERGVRWPCGRGGARPAGGRGEMCALAAP